MRYLLELSFKGTNYSGWQKQLNANSVQGEVEQKISLLLGEPTDITGCGRTDAGVHARQFFAHFDHVKKIDCENLMMRLNKILDTDIVINYVQPVKDDFHARFDADYRVYQYWIARNPDPFMKEFAWYLYGEVDLNSMNEASALLLSHTDFECFSKVHTDVKTFICKVTVAQWEEKSGKLIFTIKADRFLRNMVRAVVGTLLEVGKGKMSIADFQKVLESRNRSEAGQSVPAHGLYLSEVHYPNL